MHRTKVRVLVDGIAAGLVGGAVIAAWFFIFDAVNGRPFWSPAMLAAALLHGSREPVTMTNAAWQLVAEYSVVHFLIFAVIGAIGALMIDASERSPELFAPLVIFTAGFEVFFIALLMLAGPAAGAAAPWWKVLIGNLMATAAMTAYFFWRQPTLAENLMGPWIGVVREGVIAGIIGALIVAAWFMIADLVNGQPFHTPALLGAIIFNGLSQPGPVTASLALVLAYSALHFFAFIMFGIAASITMAASEYEPLVALGVLVLFLWFELCFVGFVTLLDQRAVEEIGWWNIIGGNVLALAAIITYYEVGHPRVVPRLMERWEQMRDEPAAEHREARPARASRI
jgi:hypothetical protein